MARHQLVPAGEDSSSGPATYPAWNGSGLLSHKHRYVPVIPGAKAQYITQTPSLTRVMDICTLCKMPKAEAPSKHIMP